MSDAPQGIFSFPGLPSILRGSFTLGHGISPSIATLVVPPNLKYVVKNGPLVITYGNTKLMFPDCRVDMASLQADQSGQIWTISIKDRRWKWEFCEITGHYNKLKPNGRIDPDTEKTPQELATLLLKAMKETAFEVNQLPNQMRPETNWQYDNPAEQLARLCDSLGCRVVLGLDNKVRICKLGNGVALPSSRVMSGGYGFDPPETPDTLKLVCAPTKYQAKLVLEAVGLDRDGEVKLIKDLSYNPAGEGETNGWGNQYPETFQAMITDNGLDAKNRALALQTVFRWYRVKDVATLDMKIPKYEGTITTYKQFLPLEDKLLDQETASGESYPQPQHAIVEGVFYDQVGDPKTMVNTARGTRYRGTFSIDKERGIVQFSEPVYQFVKLEANLTKNNRTTVIAAAGSFAYFPAEIILECSFSILDEKKRQPERYTLDRKMSNGKFQTGPKIIKREDIYRTVVSRYKSVGELNRSITDTTSLASVLAEAVPYELLPAERIVDNEKDLKVKANYYLDAEQAKYQPKESLSYSYPRIEKISPDGMIHQVSWSVGPDGATTEASQNSEFDLVVPTYAERRNLEILRLQKGEITNQLGSIASVK